MKRALRYLAALVLLTLLCACGGGGDSTTTTVRGLGLNSLGQSPAVSTHFVQADNNMVVQVDQGPVNFGVNTNLLYATVTVCYPNDPTRCDTIDHVIVDTGSVGLRVLASKIVHSALPAVQLSAAPVQNAWECFPFVIGGLWGPNVAADVVLGPQTTTSPVVIQLIDDQSRLAPTTDCLTVTDSLPPKDNILNSVSRLGANGILGIGSTNLDCGEQCRLGQYQGHAPNGSSVLYYQCPLGTTVPGACSLVPMDIPFQVYNPVAALAPDFNAGIALLMPPIPASQPGASTATGELILGLGTRANNTVPGAIPKLRLGIGISLNPDSYLSITTRYGGATFFNSYLDTGTNALFFYDSTIPVCSSSTWYCPRSDMAVQAVLSDGDDPTLHQVTVPFRISNFEALNATSNTALSTAAGFVFARSSTAPDSATFAWGMPFFYGKKVYMSIWDITAPSVQPVPPVDPPINLPWYAWETL